MGIFFTRIKHHVVGNHVKRIHVKRGTAVIPKTFMNIAIYMKSLCFKLQQLNKNPSQFFRSLFSETQKIIMVKHH